MKDVLTTAKAAQILGVSVRTAQLWVESGQLASWKTPGGHRRIPRQAVLDLIDSGPAEPILLNANAIILAGEGRSSAWRDFGLKGSGLLLDISEDILETRKWLSYACPMLVVVENAEDAERKKLISNLFSDPRLKETTIVSLNETGSSDRDDAGIRRFQLRMRPDVAATGTELLEHLKPPRNDASPSSPYPLPWNERARLEAVRRSALVGSAPEPGFDRLVDLAAFSTNSPIAMFTLLTPKEQWFKSRTGFEGESTPRAWAFCNATLLENDLTVFEDLSKEKRFASNPTLSEPYNFRFYAGAPIRDPQGFALGSMCIIDQKPRSLSSREREALRTTAEAASNLIRLRAQERELEKLRTT